MKVANILSFFFCGMKWIQIWHIHSSLRIVNDLATITSHEQNTTNKIHVNKYDQHEDHAEE